MFDRAFLQSLIDAQASLTHVVSVLAPYTFELRPVGFEPAEPSYRVLAERTAFRMKATVLPDYLAVSIVAAVVAGANNVPNRLHRLEDDIAKAGWAPNIELTSATFRIEATGPPNAPSDDEELSTQAIGIALLMSEFVLDQLVITKPVGEMRSAVERRPGDDWDSDPWVYDPSERDRSTRVHRALENWLMHTLLDRGIQPLDPAGEPFFDLAWVVSGVLNVCEVKSTSQSEVHQLRLGLGQILQYRQQLEDGGWTVRPILLVESQPKNPDWERICERVGVYLLWPSRWEAAQSELAPVRQFA